MLTPRVIRLPEPGAAEGSAVSMGCLGGGEERPGGIEGKPTSLRDSNPRASAALTCMAILAMPDHGQDARAKLTGSIVRNA